MPTTPHPARPLRARRTRRPIAWLGAAIALVAAAAATLAAHGGSGRGRSRTLAAAEGGERTRASCDTLVWSEPARVLVNDRYAAYVEQPDVLPFRDSLLLVGHSAWAADSMGAPLLTKTRGMPSLRFAGVMAAGDGGGRMVPLPPDVEQIVWPQAYPDGDGVVVVWAAMDSSARIRLPVERRGSIDDLVSVHTARWDGERWTHPAEIVASPMLMWDPIAPSRLAPWSGGERQILPLSIGAGDVALLVARERAAWKVERLAIRSLYYARLVAHPTSGLVLAHMGGGPTGNILYVRTSADGGRSWSERVRVSAPGTTDAVDPHLLAADDGTLFLSWMMRSSSEFGTSLHAARSRDGGRTWAAVADTVLPGHFFGSDAALDHRGRPVVVARHSVPAGSHTKVAVLDADRWHIATVGDSMRFTTSNPVVARAGGDTLVAAWGIARDSLVQMPPDLLVARAAPGCATRP